MFSVKKFPFRRLESSAHPATAGYDEKSQLQFFTEGSVKTRWPHETHTGRIPHRDT